MKKNKILITFLSLILISCATVEKVKSPPTSIEKLDEAANFLMLVSDDEMALKEKCGLSANEALNLMQPLHAMIDSEMSKFQDKITEVQQANCSDNCHCGLYSDLASNEKVKEKLFEQAKNIGRTKKVECAELSAKWLCGDPLLKQLKSEAEPVANGL